MYRGYCVKCKVARSFEGTVKTSDSGRRLAQGSCPVCGTKVLRILGKEEPVSVADIDRQIMDGEARVRELREQREAMLAANTDLFDLATYLHTVECKLNHTDGCGWGWEQGWDGWAHKRYLARAHKVFVEVGMTKEEIQGALDVLKRLDEVR